MTNTPHQLALFDNGCDPSQPLPLLVACLFDFDLPTETIKGQIVYRLHSWFSGMVNKKYANQAIRDLRRNGWFDQCVYAIHTLQEADSRNRLRDVEYVSDRALYRLVQDMTTDNERINAVKAYLADSGAFADMARLNPEKVAKALMSAKQSKDFLRARHSGYSETQALAAAGVREKLRKLQTEVNKVRFNRGAEGKDFGKLNALDSEIATGKKPSDWKKERGIEQTPSDYHSALQNALLYYVKREAVKLHIRNGSNGLSELVRDVRSLEEQVASTRETLQELLSDLPIELPAPKRNQLSLNTGDHNAKQS